MSKQLYNRAQREIINGSISSLDDILSGGPQVFVFMLLNIFINNLEDGIECFFQKYVDDTKLAWVAHILDYNTLSQN